MSDDAINFASRRLCPDGACIGVLGPDGRCKVCGARAEAGGSGGAAAVTSAAGDQDDVGWLEAGGADAAGDLDAGDLGVVGEDEDAFSPDRELCPDGTCVGVIGEGGRCKVCGARRG